jgi:hypothetical protein
MARLHLIPAFRQSGLRPPTFRHQIPPFLRIVLEIERQPRPPIR